MGVPQLWDICASVQHRSRQDMREAAQKLGVYVCVCKGRRTYHRYETGAGEQGVWRASKGGEKGNRNSDELRGRCPNQSQPSRHVRARGVHKHTLGVRRFLPPRRQPRPLAKAHPFNSNAGLLPYQSAPVRPHSHPRLRACGGGVC